MPEEIGIYSADCCNLMALYFRLSFNMVQTEFNLVSSKTEQKRGGIKQNNSNKDKEARQNYKNQSTS